MAVEEERREEERGGEGRLHVPTHTVREYLLNALWQKRANTGLVLQLNL